MRLLPDIPLAWLQLTRERARFLAAVAGVAFAVLLVFMQLGFSNALYASSVRVYDALDGQLFLIHPQSAYLARMQSFSRYRLYQARGFDGVESAAGVYTALSQWKNPFDPKITRAIFIFGFDPTQKVLDLPEVNRQRDLLRRPDVFLFDSGSRPEYGPVAEALRAARKVSAEVNNRRITAVGLFRMGTSFGIDGTLITSDLNLLRILPDRDKDMIDIGILRLRPGADVRAIERGLRAYLPKDVEVLTRAELEAREKAYWAESTPIGFVFTFGAIMGMVVGLVIVYQILFADISDHLAEYATLKAMGYTNRYLFSVVFREAAILALLGFGPGLGISVWLYRVAANATLLPMHMSGGLAASVLALTILMCCISGAIALRKVQSADPAEVF